MSFDRFNYTISPSPEKKITIVSSLKLSLPHAIVLRSALNMSCSSGWCSSDAQGKYQISADNYLWVEECSSRTEVYCAVVLKLFQLVAPLTYWAAAPHKSTILYLIWGGGISTRILWFPWLDSTTSQGIKAHSLGTTYLWESEVDKYLVFFA